MNVILILIPLSLIMAALFLMAFIWAVRSGQYEDTCTPNLRLLAEEDNRHSRSPHDLLEDGSITPLSPSNHPNLLNEERTKRKTP